MLFVNIGNDTYIQTSKIKAIVDSNSKVGKRLREKAEANNQYYNIVPRRSIRRSFIWMEGDVVYATFVSPQTIEERVSENGKHMICVDQGLYLSFDHIDVFSSFDSSLATRIRNITRRTSDDLNFIRRAVKKKVTIVLTTGETIGISLDIVDLLEKISKF